MVTSLVSLENMEWKTMMTHLFRSKFINLFIAKFKPKRARSIKKFRTRKSKVLLKNNKRAAKKTLDLFSL